MMHKYCEVFTGVKMLTDFQLELDIDDKMRPVAQPSRRILYCVRKNVEQKLPRQQTVKSSTSDKICLGREMRNQHSETRIAH
jgi:hypothetical protein